MWAAIIFDLHARGKPASGTKLRGGDLAIPCQAAAPGENPATRLDP